MACCYTSAAKRSSFSLRFVPRLQSSSICSVHFVPSLHFVPPGSSVQSAFCAAGIQYAVCSKHIVLTMHRPLQKRERTGKENGYFPFV